MKRSRFRVGIQVGVAALVAALLVSTACAQAPASRPAASGSGAPAAAPAVQSGGAGGSAAAPAAPAAQSGGAAGYDERAVADFYRGKTVRILVGFAAGGGYDLYSRAIGRHLRKHIPGQPTVIVENMPGAGSIVSTNHLYNVAPRDGTVIGNSSGPIIMEQLFGSSGVEYDMTKLRYLAVPVPETYFFVAHKRTGITRLDEVLGPNGKQIVIGGIPGSTVEHAPILMRDALGANIRLVSGYDGTSKVRLALESGEVDGFFNTWQSTKVTSKDKIDSGEWVQLAALNDARLKEFPNIPAIPDFAQTDEQRQILRFGTYVPNYFGKVYVVHGDVPSDRAAALEQAFRKLFADKEFLADAEKQNLDIDPIFGDDIRKQVVDFLNMSPDIRAKLQELMRPGR